MPSVIAFTIIIGIAAALMTVFLIRSYLRPRQIAGIARLIREGKARGAIRTAKQRLAKDQRNCDLHYLLGLAYLRDSKPQLALMEFRSVNQLGVFSDICPEREFRRQAAELYERFDYTDEALKECLLLTKLEPEDADHYYRAGQLFEARNQSDVAESYYRKTLELYDDHAGAHFNLGVLLLQRNLLADASSELETAVRLDPENLRGWFHLGRLQKGRREYVAALSAFGKAERNPQLKVRTLVERGSLYLQMGSVPKAILDLERAVRLAEDKKERVELLGRYYLAEAYEKTRRLDEAVGQWEKIYSMEPGFRDVGRKLSQYQVLRTDDRMKDYLTAGADYFEVICRAVVDGLGMKVRDVTPSPNGCQVMAVENGSKDETLARNVKLIRFLRSSEDIPESTARGMYEDMRKLSVHRSILVASSNFSRQAVEFAETRPIELVGREKLQELLEKSSLS